VPALIRSYPEKLGIGKFFLFQWIRMVIVSGVRNIMFAVYLCPNGGFTML
jgi:hypothetical protein